MSRSTAVRGLVATAMVSALVLFGGSPAFAQLEGYGDTPTFTVDDTTVVVGQTVTGSGTNWAADEAIQISLDTPTGESRKATRASTVVASTTADADGSFSTPIVIPSVADGQYVLSAAGDTNVLSVTITVGDGTGTDSGSSGGGLSRTGTNLAPIAGIGAAAVVLGAAAVYGTRRRRAESA